MDQVIKENKKEPVSVIFRHMVTEHWTMDKSHFHDHYEINFAVSGGNQFFINDRSYMAHAGDLFFFSNKDIHRNMVPDGHAYERYLVMFDQALLTDLSKDTVDLLNIFHNNQLINHNHMRLTKEEQVTLVSLLNEVIYQTKVTYVNNPVYSRIKLAEILLFLSHCYHKRVADTLGTYKATSQVTTYPKLQPVIEYINNHLSSDLKIDTLARKHYINRSYLCRLFKQETGFTINEYITSRRIQLAKTFLSQGKSVTEVTGLVGYQNDAHFIRVFKQQVGTTPKQYALKIQETFKYNG